MFGSAILDVAIGLVLTFLLISLILTAFQEGVEGLLKTRSKNLEQSMLELFQRDSALLQKFYDHPLIFALYRQNYSGLGSGGRNLPSYIPRELFSAALLQMHAAGDLANQPRLQGLVASIGAVTGTDMGRVRRELERWYDGAMDRASGHYKRYTQMFLFVSALIVAVLMNLNAVVLAQYLSVSTTARDQLVALAEATNERAKRPPTPPAADPATPAPAQATPQPEPGAGEEPDAIEGNGAPAAPAADTIGDGAAATGKAEGAARESGSAPTAADTAPQNVSANQLYTELADLKLPIGWSKESYAHVQQALAWNDPKPKALLTLFGLWITFIAGYLITALAAMLGAPFWFDLLNRLMVIRSTVKPTEKSPDETSNDGGTSGKGSAGSDETGESGGTVPPPADPAEGPEVENTNAAPIYG
jgi:hypothetical protein